MATFTFRIPDSMTGRLSSAEMRSWLSDFLRNPHPLPPDPGSGYERISLTLPRELVLAVSQQLRCSPSTALRRLAQERLGPPQGVRAPSEPIFRPTLLPAAGAAPWRPAPARPPVMGAQSRELAIRMAGAQLIAGVITLALILVVLYFSSTGKNTLKRT